MRKRALLVTVAAVSMLSVASVAASADTPIITVSAAATSEPDVVIARIEVCPEADSARCYQLLVRVKQGETAILDSFLSLKVSPFPSLLGELSIAPDGKSLEYRLEFVSGVLPVANVAGSVPLADE
jgi:hypothetical protein